MGFRELLDTQLSSLRLCAFEEVERLGRELEELREENGELGLRLRVLGSSSACCAESSPVAKKLGETQETRSSVGKSSYSGGSAPSGSRRERDQKSCLRASSAAVSGLAMEVIAGIGVRLDDVWQSGAQMLEDESAMRYDHSSYASANDSSNGFEDDAASALSACSGGAGEDRSSTKAPSDHVLRAVRAGAARSASAGAQVAGMLANNCVPPESVRRIGDGFDREERLIGNIFADEEVVSVTSRTSKDEASYSGAICEVRSAAVAGLMAKALTSPSDDAGNDSQGLSGTNALERVRTVGALLGFDEEGNETIRSQFAAEEIGDSVVSSCSGASLLDAPIHATKESVNRDGRLSSRSEAIAGLVAELASDNSRRIGLGLPQSSSQASRNRPGSTSEGAAAAAAAPAVPIEESPPRQKASLRVPEIARPNRGDNLESWENSDFDCASFRTVEGGKEASTAEASTEEASPMRSSESRGSESSKILLKLCPRDRISFSRSSAGATQVKTLKLTNLSDSFVAIKMKTTSPKSYLVRPVCKVLEPNGRLQVQIAFQPHGEHNNVSNHRFLIQAMPVASEAPLAREDWSSVPQEKIEEYRLVVATEAEEVPAGMGTTLLPPALPQAAPTPEAVTPHSVVSRMFEWAPLEEGAVAIDNMSPSRRAHTESLTLSEVAILSSTATLSTSVCAPEAEQGAATPLFRRLSGLSSSNMTGSVTAMIPDTIRRQWSRKSESSF